jgi:hypothetical protein
MLTADYADERGSVKAQIEWRGLGLNNERSRDGKYPSLHLGEMKPVVITLGKKWIPA